MGWLNGLVDGLVGELVNRLVNRTDWLTGRVLKGGVSRQPPSERRLPARTRLSVRIHASGVGAGENGRATYTGVREL